MLQKLHEADRPDILDYVSQEPEMNLFFIGDVENFGVDSETVEIWADVREERWTGLVLRFLDNYCWYSRAAEPDPVPIADFLRGRTVDCVSGKLSLMERLAPEFPGGRLKPTYMSRCAQPAAAAVPESIVLRRLAAAQIPALTELYSGIAEFSDSYDTPEKIAKENQSLARQLAAGSIAVGAYAGDTLVAAVTSAADNSVSAMMIGMATRVGWRGQGLASAVMAEAVRTLLAEGRQFVCLFYDNPAAGRVYRRLGFHELGAYAMLRPAQDGKE